MRIWTPIYLACAALAATSTAAAAEPNHLRVVATATRDQFKLQVTNTLNHNVRVGDFAVDDGRGTGFWVYLYDSRTRSLIRPSAMYQTPPGNMREKPATHVLRPNESKTYQAPLSDVLKFFGTSNRCNWLVVTYLRLDGQSSIRSGPSTPIEVCQ